jgi:hypothetical protein
MSDPQLLRIEFESCRIQNACKWAQLDSFPRIPADDRDALVGEMLTEIHSLYQHSVLKGIVSYVLLNANERKRLYISQTPLESARARFQSFIPGE